MTKTNRFTVFLPILLVVVYCPLAAVSQINFKLDSLRKEVEHRLADSTEYRNADIALFTNYLTASKAENSTTDIIIAYQQLASSNYAVGRINQALKYNKLYLTELEEHKNTKEFKRQQFEKNLYENEIRALTNKIKELEKEISELKAARNLTYERNFLIYIGIRVAIGIALALILGWLYLRFRKPRVIKDNNDTSRSNTDKLTELLNATKAEVIELATELDLSDILVQKNITQPEEYFEANKSLKRKFLFNQTRRLSGGVGLYLNSQKNNTVIATFMTPSTGASGGLISSNIYHSLDEIVRHLAIVEPALIIEHLDKKLRDLFPAGIPFTGGIQLAICCYNNVEKTLNYSGAGFDLFEVNKGIIYNYSGNKESLLFSETGGLFSEELIAIQKGKNFYLATDSYWLQPGGHDHKPLGRSSFEKTIQSVYRQPLPEHSVVISKLFNEWLGGQDQDRDVLVFGFGF